MPGLSTTGRHTVPGIRSMSTARSHARRLYHFSTKSSARVQYRCSPMPSVSTTSPMPIPSNIWRRMPYPTSVPDVYVVA
eukprot:2153065-Rhodomonas_salina.3